MGTLNEVEKKIIAAAAEFQKFLPKLREVSFFQGDWESVESLGLKLKEVYERSDIFELLYETGTADEKKYRDTINSYLSTAIEAYIAQDQVSGIDARQLMPNGYCRTWTIRGWNHEGDPFHFSIRNRIKNHKGEWSDNTEYLKRKTSLAEDYEVADWFLQLFVDRSDVRAPKLTAVAWCKVRDIIEYVEQASLTPQVSGYIEWFYVPLETLEAAGVKYEFRQF